MEGGKHLFYMSHMTFLEAFVNFKKDIIDSTIIESTI